MVYYLSGNRNYGMAFNQKNLMEGKIMGAPILYLSIIPLAIMIICFIACYGGKPDWCTKPDPNDASKKVVVTSKAFGLCLGLPIVLAAIIAGLWFKEPESS